jgi:hypothetical protein
MVDNQRQTIGARLTQPLGENLIADYRFDHREFRNHSTGASIDSNLLYAGLKWKPLPRLETSIMREQNVGDADPTYPTQTLLGAQYRLSSTNRLLRRSDSRPQRFNRSVARSPMAFSTLSTRETAIGIESRLRDNTSLTSNNSLDSSVKRHRQLCRPWSAHIRVPVRSGLSLDWSVNQRSSSGWKWQRLHRRIIRHYPVG